MTDPDATASADPPSAPAVPPPDPSGFELLGEVGSGGMGAVFRARDRELNREVAIKVLHEKYRPQSATGKRFVAEAHVTAQLQHPGIPPVYRMGTLPDGRPFLAMKLIKGQTLADLLASREREGPEFGRWLGVFEGICQAVGYAHAHGVIHRDLKPANVMVGAFGEVQVMDWGLAKVLEASGGRQPPGDPNDPDATRDPDPTAINSARDSDLLTQYGSILGTPAFMAPEQAIGAVDKIDRRTDVFGVGAILCVLLTGRPPYVGDTALSTRELAARAKLADCFTRLDASGAEPGLVSLCKWCLSEEPADRPADATAVATAVAALRAAADERARQAEFARERATVQAAEQRKRRRVWAALAGAVALLLAGGGAFAWWADTAARERAAEKAVAEATERQAITSALDQAEAALRADQFADATAALAQAARRLPATGFNDLRERFDDLLRTRTLVDKLDGLRHPWLTDAEAQYRGDFDHTTIPDTFRTAGWDFDTEPADRLAERVRRSPIRGWLVAVLDNWLNGAGSAYPAEWKARLLEVVCLADPHPVRVQFRREWHARRPVNIFARESPVTVEWVNRVRALDPADHPPDFLAVVFEHHFWASQLVDGGYLPAMRGAVAQHPTHLGLHLSLALALNGQSDQAEIAGLFRVARALRPDSPVLNVYLGIYLQQLGDESGAARCYKRAIGLAPDSFRPYECLGRLRIKQGKPDDAGRLFLKAAESTYPPVAAFKYGWFAELGAAFADRGELDQAWEWYGRAVEKDPAMGQQSWDIVGYRAIAPYTSVAVRGGDPRRREVARGEFARIVRGWRSAVRDRHDRNEVASARAFADEVLNAPALAAVRDPEQLAKLPADERTRWETLWADVRKLHEETKPRAAK